MRSEMKGSFPTGCISMRKGRTGMQQTAAESALFSQQSHVAIPKRSLHAGMLALVGFSPLNVIH